MATLASGLVASQPTISPSSSRAFCTVTELTCVSVSAKQGVLKPFHRQTRPGGCVAVLDQPAHLLEPAAGIEVVDQLRHLGNVCGHAAGSERRSKAIQ